MDFLTMVLSSADLIKRHQLKELHEYQKLRTNVEAYGHFCDRILPCVIGKMEWSKEVYSKEISKIATPTDEAWALLLLENSWDLWHQMAEYELKAEKLPKELRVKTKWTSTAISAVKYEGWGEDGIPRYNELVKKVREDRGQHKSFDAAFLEKKREERASKMMSSKKRNRDGSMDDNHVVCIENDLSFLGQWWDGENIEQQEEA